MKLRTILFLAISVVIFNCHAQVISEVIRVNGTQIFVSQYGKGKPVVVLQGGPGLNHSYFRPHLEELEKNFRLIYYDQRASGQSATPAADSISIDFLVNDQEAIRKYFKLDKITVLAHSWGAVLATHYAMKYPGSINKIILSNPAMLSREYDQEAGRLAEKKASAEDSVRRSALMATGMREVKNYEDFFLLSFKASAYDIKNLTRITLNLPPNFPEASKTLFTGLMKDPATQKNLYDELSSIKVRVLIIHGEADIIPPASIERLRTNIPNTTFELFSKSGHFPFVEETQKFNEVVQKFLRSKAKK